MPPSPLIVVRHAHAGSRRAWDRDDGLRPLSEKGQWQAEQLAETIASYAPTIILSSPKLRCIETVEPLAERLGLTVDVEPRLDEGPDADALLELFDELDEDCAVVSTHGDVVPDFLGALRARRNLEIADQFVWPKASSWVIDRAPNGEPTTARCLLPPVPAER